MDELSPDTSIPILFEWSNCNLFRPQPSARRHLKTKQPQHGGPHDQQKQAPRDATKGRRRETLSYVSPLAVNARPCAPIICLSSCNQLDTSSILYCKQQLTRVTTAPRVPIASLPCTPPATPFYAARRPTNTHRTSAWMVSATFCA